MHTVPKDLGAQPNRRNKKVKGSSKESSRDWKKEKLRKKDITKKKKNDLYPKGLPSAPAEGIHY